MCFAFKIKKVVHRSFLIGLIKKENIMIVISKIESLVQDEVVNEE
jgi:hypothetical protein